MSGNAVVRLDEIRIVDDALERTHGGLKSAAVREPDGGAIIGNSVSLRSVLHRVDQVAPTSATVLLLGETGTGKGQLASAIHRRSRRARHPFLVVNCAALSASLIEGELFGHERGAFTGAHAARLGRFELADGGTLFLDEIGDLPLDLQPKLLRALQHGELERVGSSRTVRVDVRVIAATNRDLGAAMEARTFREDLYYRLNVFPISLPPLRQRKEDIPLLAQYLVARLGHRLGRVIDAVPAQLIQRLCEYHWPGNVRELENVLERAIITSSGATLRLADALTPPRRPCACADVRSLREVECEHILRVLDSTGWTIEGARGAAAMLELKASTLRSKMRKLGIDRRLRDGGA